MHFLRLYSVGGRDGSSCLSSMEYYDPHTNKWNMCAPMCKRRGGVGVATCDGFLYAVGGHDAPASNHCSRLLDYVERYLLHTFFKYIVWKYHFLTYIMVKFTADFFFFSFPKTY